MNTDIIRRIDIKEETWEDKIFLTFDIDWVPDKVLEYTIDIVEKADAYATWFVTHDTPMLHRLRENPKFELGIHPNFNFLLQGDKRKGTNFKEVLDRMMDIVPEAKSVRSHSLTQNSYILQSFSDRELTHDCNPYIPHSVGIALKPWRLWSGIIQCPHFWEDDIECMNNNHDNEILYVLQGGGIKIFNFHPMHIYLNTEHISRYEQIRNIYGDADALKGFQYDGFGTMTKFLTLLKLLEK